MIDLDLLESAIKKVWFTRTPEEDGAINRVNDTIGLIELITRLRQAEKDAARYSEIVMDAKGILLISGDYEAANAIYDAVIDVRNN